DEEQNALIVRAEPNELKELESIISQLDIPREQVLIEAAIVEVTGNVGNSLGVQWASNVEEASNGVPVVTSNLSTEGQIGVGSAIAAAASPEAAVSALSNLPSGLLIGVADPFGSPANFGAIIQAIESQSNTNLLSTPSVMTLDNSEAFITVGSTVPFQTGGGTNDNPFSIDRQDVGTTLTVIPHIQQNKSVRLEVDQVVESVIGQNDFGDTTSKRQVKTEVLVQDGQTIVLGGLISDRVRETESRIPILGKLPIIGVLFKAKSTQKEKTNLMIILRPTIVQDNFETIRDNRMSGIWELRIQTLDGSKNLVQPTIDEMFEGNYINGSPQTFEIE
ncbi:MAG: secretin N-terminal domain-containing protein, partial [Reinekea sp.]|nr:secretin N-terminal domain-containing protein [Reinekea sp.]